MSGFRERWLGRFLSIMHRSHALLEELVMASTSKPHLIKRLFLVGTIAVWGTAASLATEQPSDIPAWLRSHIGEGEGQIARVVLQRARALYLKKVAAGAVKNP